MKICSDLGVKVDPQTSVCEQTLKANDCEF
jgi:hypothetical protein